MCADERMLFGIEHPPQPELQQIRISKEGGLVKKLQQNPFTGFTQIENKTRIWQNGQPSVDEGQANVLERLAKEGKDAAKDEKDESNDFIRSRGIGFSSHGVLVLIVQIIPCVLNLVSVSYLTWMGDGNEPQGRKVSVEVREKSGGKFK